MRLCINSAPPVQNWSFRIRTKRTPHVANIKPGGRGQFDLRD
jgi:hypothetical protein